MGWDGLLEFADGEWRLSVRNPLDRAGAVRLRHSRFQQIWTVWHEMHVNHLLAIAVMGAVVYNLSFFFCKIIFILKK